MSLPNLNKLIADALKELAAAKHAWNDARHEHSAMVEYRRWDKARDRVEELACMLYPAAPKPKPKPKPAAKPKADRRAARVPLQLTAIEPLRLLPAPKVSR